MDARMLPDSPTKRYGPEVEGAGQHHTPTPGPAGSKFLYGHVWVTLSWLVRHPRWGTIGLTADQRAEFSRLGDLWQHLDERSQEKVLAQIVREVVFDPDAGTVAVTLTDEALEKAASLRT